MKIKINGNGNLEIERAGKFKEQQCPFVGETSAGGSISCGDTVVDERGDEEECPF